MCHNAVLDEKILVDTPEEPVSIDEFKGEYAKIDFQEEDLLIASLLRTARRLLEVKYNVGIIEKDYYALVDNSCGMIDLPGSPIGTIATSGLDLVGGFLRSPRSCAVAIEYKSGYPLRAVPDVFKTAIKQQALYMFENRGDVTTDPTDISPAAQATMQPFSRNTLGMFL